MKYFAVISILFIILWCSVVLLPTVDQTKVVSLAFYPPHLNKIAKGKNAVLVRAWERRGSEHIVVQMLLKQRGGGREQAAEREGGRKRWVGGKKEAENER